MRTWREIFLDEKVITCAMAIFFALGVILFVWWKADKEYVSIFGGAVTMLIGSLLRGITHAVPQPPNTIQTTTKEDIK